MRILACIASLAVALIPMVASADEPAKGKSMGQINHRKGAIGVGLALVRFDTKIKFTDKASSLSVFLDPEGNLDLPEIARVNTFYGTYRLGRKHEIEMAYFAVKRESTFISANVNYEDLVLVNGQATLSDDTKFYFFQYSYALFQDNRSNVNASLGISGLDLNYTFSASGEIIVDGVREFGSYDNEASVFAPLPLLGVDFNFAVTPKWAIGGKVSLVSGSYEEIRAFAAQTGMQASYWFGKHVGGVIGISHFNADVTLEEEKDKTDISYGYGGVYAGLHFAF